MRVPLRAVTSLRHIEVLTFLILAVAATARADSCFDELARDLAETDAWEADSIAHISNYDLDKAASIRVIKEQADRDRAAAKARYQECVKRRQQGAGSSAVPSTPGLGPAPAGTRTHSVQAPDWRQAKKEAKKAEQKALQRQAWQQLNAMSAAQAQQDELEAQKRLDRDMEELQEYFSARDRYETMERLREITDRLKKSAEIAKSIKDQDYRELPWVKPYRPDSGTDIAIQNSQYLRPLTQKSVDIILSIGVQVSDILNADHGAGRGSDAGSSHSSAPSQNSPSFWQWVWPDDETPTRAPTPWPPNHPERKADNPNSNNNPRDLLHGP